MRATRAVVQHHFNSAMPNVVLPFTDGNGTDNSHNIGRVALDYAACYGGYVVVMMEPGDSGAGWCISHPYGARRRPAREMIAYLEGFRHGFSDGMVHARHGDDG